MPAVLLEELKQLAKTARKPMGRFDILKNQQVEVEKPPVKVHVKPRDTNRYEKIDLGRDRGYVFVMVCCFSPIRPLS